MVNGSYRVEGDDAEGVVIGQDGDGGFAWCSQSDTVRGALECREEGNGYARLDITCHTYSGLGLAVSRVYSRKRKMCFYCPASCRGFHSWADQCFHKHLVDQRRWQPPQVQRSFIKTKTTNADVLLKARHLNKGFSSFSTDLTVCDTSQPLER